MRYFVVKSDQHIVEPGTLLYGIDTGARAQKYVQTILNERVKLELIIDLGDVADTTLNPDRATAIASKAAYENASQIFSALPKSRLYIPGNHDDPKLIYSILGNHWQRQSAGCCEYDLGSTTLIGIDTRTGPEATGYLSQETAQALEDALKKSRRAILFTHYPWFPTDNGRINLDLKVTNGEALTNILNRYRDKILGVFHGHLHLWWTNVVAHIPVYCCPGSSFAFGLEPNSSELQFVDDTPLGYYLVGLDEESGMIVRPRFVLYSSHRK